MLRLGILIAVFGLFFAACGDDKNTCTDVANKMKSCAESQGGSLSDADYAEIRTGCEAVTCTGDKQAAIDCMMALACTASIETQAEACGAQQGCDIPDM